MKTGLTLLLLFLTAAAYSQAKVRLDKTTHDFGKVPEGPDVTATFRVINTGNSTLIIKDVSKPCGCTDPEFSKEKIQPGDSGWVKVTYHTQDHVGTIYKTLQIQTNDAQGVHEITVVGEVVEKELPLKFDSEVWDFGSIPQNFQVKHRFYIKNTRKQPLIINDVSRNGAGIPPVWTRQPILPGDSGYVEVGYAAGNIGDFIKQVDVQTNAGTYTLAITGNVYMSEIGPRISFDKTTHDFGKIPHNVPATAEFIYTNTGDAPLIVMSVTSSCGCVLPDHSEGPVLPGKTGWVRYTYNAAAVGVFTKTGVVSSNAGDIDMFIKGEVVDSLGPQISFDKTTHDFGEIPFNIPATVEFIYTNTGDEPLVIDRVNSSCGCMVPSYSKEPVLPGKTGWVKLTFSAGFLGNFNKTASVFTNASEPVILMVKGTVVKKNK